MPDGNDFRTVATKQVSVTTSRSKQVFRIVTEDTTLFNSIGGESFAYALFATIDPNMGIGTAKEMIESLQRTNECIYQSHHKPTVAVQRYGDTVNLIRTTGAVIELYLDLGYKQRVV